MDAPVWDYSDLLEEAKERIEEKLMMEGEIKNDQHSNLQ